MAKSTGGRAADFPARVDRRGNARFESRPLAILNFHYRIFAPLWL
jgi:hypothetical protein